VKARDCRQRSRPRSRSMGAGPVETGRERQHRRAARSVTPSASAVLAPISGAAPKACSTSRCVRSRAAFGCWLPPRGSSSRTDSCSRPLASPHLSVAISNICSRDSRTSNLLTLLTVVPVIERVRRRILRSRHAPDSIAICGRYTLHFPQEARLTPRGRSNPLADWPRECGIFASYPDLQSIGRA
jgi:hypothetical protein